MKPWIMVRKGIRLNKFLEGRMLWIVGTAYTCGAIFHTQLSVLKPIVPYLFFYMTFVVALNCSTKDFRNSIKAPGPILTILGMLHIVLPILATVLAKLFLPGQPLLQAGIVLGTAAPIGVASSIWISMSGGNNALGLTSVIADTILSPFIVPSVMLVAIGQSVKFDVISLIVGLAWMVVLPTILGMLLNDLTKGQIYRKVKFVTAPSSKFFLMVVISINLAVSWGSLHLLKTSLGMVLLVVLTMACSGYLLGYAVAKLFRKSPEMVNTYIFSIGIRNITAGLVLALKYFPEMTAIPVVFSIVLQQPLAAVSHRFLIEKTNGKNN